MTTRLRKGLYRHFKGKLYEVLGVARHSETLEEFVVYKALYKTKDRPFGALWVRPAAMFLETIVREGKRVRRFERLSPESPANGGTGGAQAPPDLLQPPAGLRAR